MQEQNKVFFLRFFDFGSKLFFEIEPTIYHLMGAILFFRHFLIIQSAVMKKNQVFCILLVEFYTSIFTGRECSVRDEIDALCASLDTVKEHY